MYVKIPNFVGERTINLTMEYVQEVEIQSKFEEKKKDKQQAVLTSFSIYFINTLFRKQFLVRFV